MRECIREIEAFYEADGPYAVSEEQARFILEEAIDRATEYTYASIALKSLEARSLGEQKGAASLENPQVGSHVAYLTRRLVASPDGQVAKCNRGLAAMAISTDQNGFDKVIGSSLLVRVTGRGRRDDQHTVVSAVHELGHTFRLPHCPQANPVCAMRASSRLGVSGQDSLSAFCYSCTADFRGLTNQYLSHSIS